MIDLILKKGEEWKPCNYLKGFFMGLMVCIIDFHHMLNYSQCFILIFIEKILQYILFMQAWILEITSIVEDDIINAFPRVMK